VKSPFPCNWQSQIRLHWRLDSEKIQTASAEGTYTSLPDAQWSDTLSKLVQVKLLRSFENARRFAGVSRPLEAVKSDFQLVLDIRKFQISANHTAEVEIGCKLLDGSGRIVATHTLKASAPVEGPAAASAVASLDKAFGQVGADIVSWTADATNEPPPPRAVTPKRTSRG
jgi:ABC-type uncharacterized transport system auxiliary subunit